MTDLGAAMQQEEPPASEITQVISLESEVVQTHERAFGNLLESAKISTTWDDQDILADIKQPVLFEINPLQVSRPQQVRCTIFVVVPGNKIM